METLSIQQTKRPGATPPPALRTVQDLSGRDDSELLAIITAGPPGSGPAAAARELLVTRYRDLVRSCVRRYRNSPEPAEDLMQAGYLGLVKAINNFNPAKGTILAAYAHACVTGELKRHFRDKRWQIHIERSTQERLLAIQAATHHLTQQHGHQPTTADLARHLNITTKELAAARTAETARHTCSLDTHPTNHTSGPTLADLLGTEDPQIQHTLDLHALATHWHELPHREQHILAQRFYADKTQAQIGQQLGISQMQVSRLLTHALRHLRHRLLTDTT